VIFDIGGVLEITPRTGWDLRWDERLGLAPGSIDRRMRDVWQAGAVGGITETGVREQVGAVLGLDLSGVEAFMADLWAEYLGSANAELIAYARTLRPRARVGILSNSFVGAREREQEAYRFGDFTDEIVYSHEIGICKPDPQAFAVTCDRMAASPGDCLFIDDVPAYAEAAVTAGMQAVCFTDNATVMARIAAHLDS
jgi:putative hydrolase of the HAD superfamily